MKKAVLLLLVLLVVIVTACSKSQKIVTNPSGYISTENSTLIREISSMGRGIGGCAAVGVRRDGRYIRINIQKLVNENLPDWPLKKGDQILFVDHNIACMTSAQHEQAQRAMADYVDRRPIEKRTKIDCRCMALHSELILSESGL